MKIILIGFMCSGKTTVGRLLAQRLGVPFVDLDREAEREVGPLLQFIQREGESAFRELETSVLHAFLDGDGTVIATGGGTPCEGDNLQRMKAAGTVVWLDVPLDLLMLRIERAGGDRPLLFGLKDAALRQRVNELLSARTPVYAQAHLTIAAGASPTDVAQRISEALSLT